MATDSKAELTFRSGSSETDVLLKHGLRKDTIEELESWPPQLVAKIVPVLVKAFLAQNFQMKLLLEAEFETGLLDSNSDLARRCLAAGRAYAVEAQKVRDAGNDPDTVMGPARVHVFLTAMDAP